jgi:hypothetical protein
MRKTGGCGYTVLIPWPAHQLFLAGSLSPVLLSTCQKNQFTRAAFPIISGSVNITQGLRQAGVKVVVPGRNLPWQNKRGRSRLFADQPGLFAGSLTRCIDVIKIERDHFRPVPRTI